MTAAGVSTLLERVAVVTGASRGVGAAIAVTLADQGAVVVAVSRSGRVPDGAGASVHAIAADLSVDDDIGRLCDTVAERFGQVSIIVHSAGLFGSGPTASASVTDLDDLLRVNLRAPYILTKRLLQDVTATRGDVVFIGSATAGRATVGQYAATKAGLSAFADSLREEMNPVGVRVTTIQLGRTATDMQRAVHRTEGRPFDPDVMIQPMDVAATVAYAVTLPHSAQLADVRLLPLRRVGG